MNFFGIILIVGELNRHLHKHFTSEVLRFSLLTQWPETSSKSFFTSSQSQLTSKTRVNGEKIVSDLKWRNSCLHLLVDR